MHTTSSTHRTGHFEFWLHALCLTLLYDLEQRLRQPADYQIAANTRISTHCGRSHYRYGRSREKFAWSSLPLRQSRVASFGGINSTNSTHHLFSHFYSSFETYSVASSTPYTKRTIPMTFPFIITKRPIQINRTLQQLTARFKLAMSTTTTTAGKKEWLVIIPDHENTLERRLEVRQYEFCFLSIRLPRVYHVCFCQLNAELFDCVHVQGSTLTVSNRGSIRVLW